MTLMAPVNRSVPVHRSCGADHWPFCAACDMRGKRRLRHARTAVAAGRVACLLWVIFDRRDAQPMTVGLSPEADSSRLLKPLA
jgi:hypothetical protein